MRVPRIFEPTPLIPGQHLALSEDGANHVGRVLRMQAGQPLVLFNGEGGQYSATISAVNKRQVEVTVEAFDAHECESPWPCTWAR